MKSDALKAQNIRTTVNIPIRSEEYRSFITNSASDSIRLKPDERSQLEKCEEVLRRGLGTFFEVGQALLIIREAQLYREEFSTFQLYCQDRWGMGRNYAWRLMGAAERIRLLPSDAKTPRPANEFQVRPFLKLEPKAFPEAWEQVISKAKDGKITASFVKGCVAQMTSKLNDPEPQKNQRRKPKKLPKGCSVGSILVLLTEAKRGIQSSDPSKALGIIDRIELELLGMSHE